MVKRLAAIPLLILCGGLLMALIFEARINELNTGFVANSDSSMSLRTIGLISRFQMVRDRMRKGENISSLKAESALLFSMSDSIQEVRPKYHSRYVVGQFIVNAVNFLAGVPRTRMYKESKTDLLLEEAYILELRRDFTSAAEKYDTLMRSGQITDNGTENFVRLHRGFCWVFSGNLSGAINDFQHVLERSASDENRFTAEILLAYAQDFSVKFSRIGNLKNPQEKGIAYFGIGSYSDAIKSLEGIPESGRNTRARYVLGRSYEELGKTPQALAHYREIISTRPDAEFAVMANRRIYAIGALYNGQRSLVNESQGNAKTTLNDGELLAVSSKNALVSEAMIAKKTDQSAQPHVDNGATGVHEAEPKEVARKILARSYEGGSGGALAVQDQPAQIRDLETLTRAERKFMLQKETLIEEVVLVDGNRIFGKMISEEAHTVTFFTLLGKLVLKKAEILRIESKDTLGVFK